MRIAQEVATRATCDRKHVGCVLVRDRNILSTGYNGSIAGLGHCDDDGHLMENNSCQRTVHAEQNAIAMSAKHGTAINGATAYVTAFPCWNCFKLLMNSGIIEIYYLDAYRPNQNVLDAASALNIGLHQVVLE